MVNHYRYQLGFLLIGIAFFILGVAQVYAQGKSCGNGVCQSSLGETCSSCPQDCGACSTPTPPPSTPTPTPAPSSTPNPSASSTPAASSGNGGGSDTTDTSSSSASNTSTSSTTYYPTVTLSRDQLTFSGTASIEQGEISGVEYSLDSGGSWTGVSAQDGSFNSSSEKFSFQPEFSFSAGDYILLVRAKSLAQVYTQSGSYASSSFSITPPTIVLSEFSPNPTKSVTPTIEAVAKSLFFDISKVEVSLDGGESWIPMTKSGNKYTLTSSKLEDGNYEILVRAIDAIGGSTVSAPQTLIIDTIPPIIGGSLYSLGPQTLKPDKGGKVGLVAGSESYYFVSMKGGVTNAKISAGDEAFELAKEKGTNIWYAKLNFKSEGVKELSIAAEDGAGNKTDREVGQVRVDNFGKVTNRETKASINKARVTVYYFQPLSGQWLVWNGESFGQKNPQVTTDDGQYSFMLPSGKYYIEAKADGFKTMRTNILTTDEATVINSEFELAPKPAIFLNLPLLGGITFTVPTLIPDSISLKFPMVPAEQNVNASPLIGAKAPDYKFKTITGDEVNLSSLLGKNTLITFLSPWSSPSLEQALVLSSLSSSLSGNEAVIGISLQESASSMSTFMRRGNYDFKLLIDENGESASGYQVSLLPEHFWIDKGGVIREVSVGVLSKDEILEKLKNL